MPRWRSGTDPQISALYAFASRANEPAARTVNFSRLVASPCSTLPAANGTACHAPASTRAIASRFASFGHRAHIRIKLRFDHIYRATDDILAGSELALLDVGCGIALLGHYLLGASAAWCIQASIAI